MEAFIFAINKGSGILNYQHLQPDCIKTGRVKQSPDYDNKTILKIVKLDVMCFFR